MEYKNILFPLHTFKDNRMEMPKFVVPVYKTEQKVAITSNNQEKINDVIRTNPDWQVQSIVPMDAVNVIILFHRMVSSVDNKPIEDY